MIKFSRLKDGESEARVAVFDDEGTEIGRVSLSLNHYTSPDTPNEYQYHAYAELYDDPAADKARGYTVTAVDSDHGWIVGLEQTRAYLRKRGEEMAEAVRELYRSRPTT